GAILKGVEQGALAVLQPTGEAYDAEGVLAGPPEARRRVPGQRIAGLRLESDVLVAPMEAPCVEGWMKESIIIVGPAPLLTVDEAATIKDTTAEKVEDALDLGLLDAGYDDGQRKVVNNDRFRVWAPSHDDGTDSEHTVSTTSWEQAVAYAAERPLQRVTLRTGDLPAAGKLIAAASPFGATALALNVTVSGTLKEGGTLQFMVDGASYAGALKPIDLAGTMLRASVDEGRSLDAELVLTFGEQGLAQAGHRLQQAQKACVQNITMTARFGPVHSEKGA
ncbi:MAG: hypothetical protein GXY79_11140, partial [Chloroflexi bacterium]|nr:hypothetical protein [Chloroflexota bacterium]